MSRQKPRSPATTPAQVWEEAHDIHQRMMWLRRHGQTPGIEAAIEADRTGALTEDFRRRVAAARQHPETLQGTLGGVEMGQVVLAMLIEQDHDKALHHLIKDCPAPTGMCERCTAPATVQRAAAERALWLRELSYELKG